MERFLADCEVLMCLCALNGLVPPDGGILLLLRQKKYPRKGDPATAPPSGVAPRAQRRARPAWNLSRPLTPASPRTSRPAYSALRAAHEGRERGGRAKTFGEIELVI